MSVEWKRGCPEWIDEDGSPIAERKRRRLLRRLVRKDYAKPPSAELVKAWHRALFLGIAPHRDYVGQFRDEDRTSYCLRGYEVVVGDIPGTESSCVLQEVETFFNEFDFRLKSLEGSFPSSDAHPPGLGDVTGVVALAAWVHGEWVRIHPFANGNGRTARLLANYILIRFGFGPALAIRPRPGQPYGSAAMASMREGDHKPMEAVIWRLLAESYRQSG